MPIINVPAGGNYETKENVKTEINNHNTSNNAHQGMSFPANGGNADTVDGKHASEFATSTQGTKADNALPKSSYTASDILTKLKTVDGTGSGLDADLLDGKHSSNFAEASQITSINTALNNKVDKITGKGLSTNDFTADYKTKLDGIQTGAESNVQSDWNITATNSDAYIKNKPTSFPANGGNADTVDGKHASEFATAAQGTKADNALPATSYTASDVLTKLKTVDGYASGLDADLLDGRHASSFILKTCTKVNSRQEIKESGLYFMSKANATDLPISGHDFIIFAMQNNLDINIIAISTSDTDYMYTCSGHSNDSGKIFIYGNWKKSNDNADTQKLKGIVPIKSGGTGADNITNALKNLKLKNDSILKEPCSAVLNVGAFAISASKSMTILEFATAMPLDTSVIFRNAKLESPSISDAPTNYGEILFIKGSTLNYMYAL